jgi:hypothetical protein
VLLIALGRAGWSQHRRILPRLDTPGNARRAFIRLAVTEVLITAAAMGLSVALSSSAPRFPAGPERGCGPARTAGVPDAAAADDRTEALLADQHIGGGVAWATGELPTVLIAIILGYLWQKDDRKETIRRDRDNPTAMVTPSSPLTTPASNGSPTTLQSFPAPSWRAAPHVRSRRSQRSPPETRAAAMSFIMVA